MQRARIVLLAADGLPNAEIARRTGTSRPTVVGWRARYAEGGIAALDDQPRSERPKEIDEIEVVVATLADEGRPPEHLGVTHWSARLLAADWASRLPPWPGSGASGTCSPGGWRRSSSPDPELDAKIRDIVGLYVNPPDNAVVLCVDEKSRAPRGADGSRAG